MLKLKVKKIKDKGNKVRVGAFLKKRKTTKYEMLVGIHHLMFELWNCELCDKSELKETILKYIDNFEE